MVARKADPFINKKSNLLFQYLYSNRSRLPKPTIMRSFIIAVFCMGCLFASAQTPSKIADKTKNMKRYDGYFTFWWDAANGKIWLQVDKLDKEFLYVNSLPAGLGSNDIGLDRGLIGGSRIVSFNKVGKKLFLVQPNYSYRASSADKNEQRAVKESFAQSTIASFVGFLEAVFFVLAFAMRICF